MIRVNLTIQNKVNKPCYFNLTRRDDVIISRIRISHSRLTHSYLLKGKQQPECIFCDCQLTIQHTFDAFHVRDSLLRYLQMMQELFSNLDIEFRIQFWNFIYTISFIYKILDIKF